MNDIRCVLPLIRERFGLFWNIFSVGDLFMLNFMTLLTEFIGVNFALAYGGQLLLARRKRIAAGGSADRLADIRHLDRNTWRMPPLDKVAKPVMSPVRMSGLILLRGYLIVAVLLITIKIFSNFIH
jgi:hypothetical protein